ncbi:tetratricopeptide repeat protein [Wenyingzhuangia aestuarii]|uniref:tetratricopeptide repeat protein n=1 Tax=Wenyingzhuangia aestuarii TaxID=1647582 RepID=UPI00143AADAB|nr:tetratricopeptide repeat protein [Wenyingzhuangia aestuarii]NJB81266.1 Tfp pilus assembly protein PilF [Wenyingzhuangia aestuarii]
MKKIYLLLLTTLLFIACKNTKDEGYQKVDPMSIFTNTDSIPNKHYVGSQKCKECHADQFQEWEGSHHDKSMQKASRESIIAPFKGEVFKSQGVTSTFFQKDGKFYANTEGRDGKNHDFQIIYTFGLTPLQQYIVLFPDGHYQCLRTAYDTVKGKWFDLYPDFKVVHSEWLHWSRGGLNWNTMCSDCHSTNVKKNYNEKDHSYDTNYAIINVSCEACHGPGKEHVSNAIIKGDHYKTDGTMQMTNLGSKELVDACARCHARRENVSLFHTPEGTFLDHYFPQLIRENLYHADGQILDEDYVYGSFVQSKMYHNGVSCKDCHNVHSTKRKFNDNRLCLQCHEGPKYDTESHHKHPMGTESALCINCHMTGKHYMGNDFRRDHSFRIPRPDLSLKYNSPNACAGCHKDKDDQWAYDNFVKLYGEPKKDHFSDKLAPGITRAEGGKDSLMALANDTVYPNIARASAVSNLNNYVSEININDVLKFLKDDSPLVKGAAADLMFELKAGTENYKALLPLLKDKKRAVRTKAFFALSAVPASKIPEEYKPFYNKVKIEFANVLKVGAEFSGGRMKRAQYYMSVGKIPSAIKTLEEALVLDPINNIVRTTLANLYYQNKQYIEAEKAYKTIIKQEPGFGLTNFDYGLLLNELGRPKEAIEQLKKALEFMPDNDRIVYNLALLHFKNNQTSNAISVLKTQLKRSANNTDLIYLLAYIYHQNKQIKLAKDQVEKLLQLDPNNQQYQQFYQALI